ncbi:hypothetical protein Pint_36498 [Pistacia integerrima]|uniref:Uncharacterized protein n=1 Tax=Pistacia integerrima TaxID=434235 RepID=A0ACC0Y3P2_9ROSI|nr:hypothetical protein Pint_36498 [Pistacia integerrima]
MNKKADLVFIPTPGVRHLGAGQAPRPPPPMHLHHDKTHFLNTHKNSIRAVVGNAAADVEAELIEALPKLEIAVSFSVGLDKVDLGKCKEKGIRVTNTPDVLTDDVADLAIGLTLAVLRRLCESDRYLRSGKWKRGDYKLTTKRAEIHRIGLNAMRVTSECNSGN